MIVCSISTLCSVGIDNDGFAWLKFGAVVDSQRPLEKMHVDRLLIINPNAEARSQIDNLHAARRRDRKALGGQRRVNIEFARIEMQAVGRGDLKIARSSGGQ